jgi:hypothetical protein
MYLAFRHPSRERNFQMAPRFFGGKSVNNLIISIVHNKFNFRLHVQFEQLHVNVGVFFFHSLQMNTEIFHHILKTRQFRNLPGIKRINSS